MDAVESFRERLLKRYLLVAATLGIAYLAGLDVSPAFDTVSFYLASFGRYGIPFNAVYGPRKPQGIVLPTV